MSDDLTDFALGRTRGVHDTWCDDRDPHPGHAIDEEDGAFCPGVGPQPLPGGIGRFKLACRSCPVPKVLAFASPAERGGWASEHTRVTGHRSWLVRDGGEITIFFIAECQDCEPVLPQPFYGEGERDQWAGAHSSATGHAVGKRVEFR